MLKLPDKTSAADSGELLAIDSPKILGFPSAPNFASEVVCGRSSSTVVCIANVGVRDGTIVAVGAIEATGQLAFEEFGVGLVWHQLPPLSLDQVLSLIEEL